MASLRDNKNPYWCAGLNQGCIFVVREGWLWRLRILDENNRPLPPERHVLIEKLEPCNEPDSKPLPRATFFVRVVRLSFPTFCPRRRRSALHGR